MERATSVLRLPLLAIQPIASSVEIAIRARALLLHRPIEPHVHGWAPAIGDEPVGVLSASALSGGAPVPSQTPNA